MYKEPKPTSKKVPEPDWVYTLENQKLGRGLYDKKVRVAAKPSKADGYMQSGTDNKNFGI
jgi:hypothetical protein